MDKTKVKNITKTFSQVIKAVKDPSNDIDDSLWAIASAEVPDTVGDIVSIDGIDTLTYHNPPNSHMKLLAGHKISQPNGEPTVIGRIEEFRQADIKVDGKSVKSLQFRFSWAKDANGNLTDLAKKYQELYPEYINSFSVGFSASYKNMQENDHGGFTFNKSNLHEISLVSVPANASAQAIKRIKDVLGEEAVDAPAGATEPEQPDKSDIKDEDKSASTQDSVSLLPDSLKLISEEVLKAITPQLNELKSSIDAIESALLIQSKQAPQTESQNKGQPTRNVNRLNEMLDKLNHFLDS